MNPTEHEIVRGVTRVRALVSIEFARKAGAQSDLFGDPFIDGVVSSYTRDMVTINGDAGPWNKVHGWQFTADWRNVTLLEDGT